MLLPSSKKENSVSEHLLKKEVEGDEMDPRLQYYMKFIENAPLNPSSIDAKDLNWEGYNYSRQFKLPAEIVDHLDANKIPLHYQANVDTILNENFMQAIQNRVALIKSKSVKNTSWDGGVKDTVA